MTYNGEVDAVGGVVMMLKGENSNEVVKIKEKLPTIQKSLPDDIIIEPYLDRTDLVDRAMSTVEKT
jgi:cobalt-zinc-cadmium resistance protein CzcA